MMTLRAWCAAALVAALFTGAPERLHAQDPVRVTARLTDARVAVGQPTTLQISVQSDGSAPEQIRLPTLPDALDIVGTSDYSQTEIRVPGGRTRTTRRDVVIVPRAPGVHRIPPVSVTVRGTLYSTAPLDLVVTGQAPAPGSIGGSGGSGLQVMVTPDTVYVGEQVLFRAEANLTEEARLRQGRPPVFDPPAPTGFWVQDLPDPVSVRLSIRDGRRVETQTFRRAYFPLRPGDYRLPPARLIYEVRRGFLYPTETRELVSDSARLVVLDVPAAGRPASWNGAVGSLAMRTSASAGSVAAGDPLVITVELEGTGNIKALPAPTMPALPGADVFTPTQESVIAFDGDRVGGLKRFRWMVVPSEPGVLVIPPIEYAAFDPATREYAVLSSDSLRVDVLPAVAGSVAGEAAGRSAAQGIRGLRREPGGDRLSWTRSTAFAAAQALPVMLLAGVVLLRRRRDRPAGGRQRERAAMAQLDALRTDADPAELEHALLIAVLEMLGTPEAPPASAEAALRAGGRSVAADRLAELLRELRRVRYEPGARFDAAPAIDRAKAFIASLRVSPRGRPAAGGAAVAILLLAGGIVQALMTSGPVAAVDVPSQATRPAGPAAASAELAGNGFGRAIGLFEAGDAVSAANAFHAWSVDHPTDVDGWYNAGVAAYHAGDRGRAVWAWLRALELAPRDGDILHNLEVAGAASVAGQVLPPDRLSGSERAVVASIAWWVLLGSLALVGLGRRHAAWVAATAAVILAGVALAAVVAGSRPAIVVPLADGAALYPAPTAREAPVGELLPGSSALVVERRDDWLLVRARDGSDAWVERVAVARP